MPNLEYSVRFVLASDSTSEIDQALARMREVGSTINVKVNVDTSGITREMRSVESEIKKAEGSTERLSRSTEKSSKQFNKLSSEIRKAMNEFKATGNIENKARDFENLSRRIEDYGSRLRDAGKDLDTYFQLQNKLASAERTVTNAMNNSKGVLDARAKAEKAVAMEATRANQAIVRSVTGTSGALRRLAREGAGTAEEISTFFGRTTKSTEDLRVSSEDLQKAYERQRQIVTSSNLPLETREMLLRRLAISQAEASRTMSGMNVSLNQQEGDVGNVSYAMMSFTRLLEDVPYGFRGFANNIQPTIFGLVQMNEHTREAADNYRRLHNREMPLAQRAMLNFRQALTGPVNQILLLTSVIAVAGTFIERFMGNADKASKSTTDFAQSILGLYSVIQNNSNLLLTNIQAPADSLKNYQSVLATISAGLKEQIDLEMRRLRLLQATPNATREELNVLRDRIKSLKESLDSAEEIKDGVDERVTALEKELRTLNTINDSEETRLQTIMQQVSLKNAESGKELINLQDQLEIQRTIAREGEIAGAKLRSRLRLQRLSETQGFVTVNQARAEAVQLEIDILAIGNRRTRTNRDIRNEYEGMLRALRRQLEDEEQMSQMRRLEIDEIREIEDVRSRVAERRRQDEKISIEQEEALVALVKQRFYIMRQISEEQSRQAVESLVAQFETSELLVKSLQKRLLGNEEGALKLEYQAEQLEFQQRLSESIRNIRRDNFFTEEDYQRALQATTEELKNQRRIQLMNRQLSADADIQEYVSPATELQRAEAEMREMQLAALDAFLAEEELLKMNSEISDEERRKRMIEETEKFNKRINEIDLRGGQISSFIRFKTAKEGFDLVAGAMEQFLNGAEARNRKQFEFQKKLAISLASINTYLAVSEVLKDPNISPSWLKYPAAAAMLIQGLAQVNSIRNTQYGGVASGGVSGGRQSAPQQGFVEVQQTQALAGATATMTPQIPTTNITVIGNVDREGIAFAVREGENMISSRATFAR